MHIYEHESFPGFLSFPHRLQTEQRLLHKSWKFYGTLVMAVGSGGTDRDLNLSFGTFFFFWLTLGKYIGPPSLFLYLKTDESSLSLTGLLWQLNEMTHVLVESSTHKQHSINDIRIIVREQEKRNRTYILRIWKMQKSRKKKKSINHIMLTSHMLTSASNVCFFNYLSKIQIYCSWWKWHGR